MSAGPVVVVGGGIAGLTAALELAEAGVPVTVVEAADRFGGKIATYRVDGLVVEAGADSFLSTKPAGLALVERLGISDRLVTPKRRTGALSSGPAAGCASCPKASCSAPRPGPGRCCAPACCHRPERPAWSATSSSPGAAAPTTATAAGPPAAEETVAEFFTRRLGPEAYARVVEPLLAGIHAGDATKPEPARHLPPLRRHGAGPRRPRPRGTGLPAPQPSKALAPQGIRRSPPGLSARTARADAVRLLPDRHGRAHRGARGPAPVAGRRAACRPGRRHDPGGGRAGTRSSSTGVPRCRLSL